MTTNKPLKPCLVIMAAGIGSRYGGNKQLDSMTEFGETIMDFSLYDAYRAGFRDAVVIIRHETEPDFHELLDNGAGKFLNVQFAFQDKNDVLGLDLGSLTPEENRSLLDERTKPWGTGHAVLSARNLVQGPFAVINADDYYGREAFSNMYNFLSSSNVEGSEDRGEGALQHFAMVGYSLDMTLSESGHVSRGVCSVSDDSTLLDITERTMIKKLASGETAYSEDDGQTWTPLPEDTTVSMNFWGFSRYMMDELERSFPEALKTILETNPAKGEFYLPGAVDTLLKSGKADVKVLKSKDKWYGVTNKEDKAGVMAALAKMKEEGTYPEKLWEEIDG